MPNWKSFSYFSSLMRMILIRLLCGETFLLSLDLLEFSLLYIYIFGGEAENCTSSIHNHLSHFSEISYSL